MAQIQQDQWPEIIGAMILQWGRIEHLMTMTIISANVMNMDYGARVDPGFKYRLTQWRAAVALMGQAVIDPVHGKLDTLRNIRDNIVHGIFVPWPDAVECFVQFPNASTKQQSFAQHVSRLRGPQREWVMENIEQVKRHLGDSPVNFVRYPSEKIVRMVHEELPELRERLSELMRAADKKRRESSQ